MSKWLHLICEDCWHKVRGTMLPTRPTKFPLCPCCYCGKPTHSGIITRDDPELVPCKAKGKVHDE